MQIINIPIEPLEERYSIDWQEWFAHDFFNNGLQIRHILGSSTSGKVNRGSFLDVVETNVYKTSQLAGILEILANYDDKEPLVLFFQDLWFPGLANIAYVRDGLGLKNLYITGCLHAGSYDPYDFLAKQKMTNWAKSMEYAWFEHIVDRIYVATRYHKELLCTKRNISNEKVIVTGFPIYMESIPVFRQAAENIIVFPHRLDSEKQPDQFDALHELCRDESEMLGWRWVKTKEVCKTKEEYYKLLQKSKIAVSCALQETWGIAMQEAVLCGCYPIVPDRLSYSEMYAKDFRYHDSNLQSAKKLIVHFMIQDREKAELLRAQQLAILSNGEQAIPEIIRNIKELVQ